MLKQAVSLHREGNLVAADELYAQILAAAPDDFDALHLIGVLRHQQGRHGEGLAFIDAALAKRPDSVDALSNRGAVLAKLKRPQESLASYDRALALSPREAEAHYGRANTLRDLGRHEEAVTSYDRALAAKPDHAQACYNRGNALQDLHRHAEALASYDRALALTPNHLRTLHNRGRVLQALDDYPGALASFERALAVDANYAEAWNGRGMCLQHLGRHDDAIASYEKALAIAPRFAQAHHNRGMAYLLKGDFAAGWPDYEWRWETAQLRRPDFPCPVWDGTQPLAGKTIVLHAEQGLGDAIMFMRYVPRVVAQGARVALALPAPLIPLFSGMAGIERIVGPGESLPEPDLQCPLMSLPLAFKTSPAAIPAEVPYVLPSPDLVTKWAGMLGPADRLRVGLVWSGNPQHFNDRNRSIPLEKLAPLLGQRSVELVTFRPNVRAADADVLRRHPHIRLFDEDFPNVAAIVSLLDLVICVDTALAHLAGAMAKPVWIALPSFPDWRWLLDRADSPWYPTARLFRQTRAGDWTDVIDHLAHELASLAASRN